MRGTLVVVAAVAMLGASCGGTRKTVPTHAAGPAPKLEGAHLRGPIPGEEVEGAYRDADGRPVDNVHRLLVIGEGDHRAVLLLGRRGDRPCVAAVPEARAENAPLDCFESFENPPLVVKLVVGGKNPRGTDWLAVLGVARAPTERVVLERQTAPLKAPLMTRSWRGFPWWAFGAMTERGNLGNELSAFDKSGEPVISSIDLGFSYNTPCQGNNEDVCGPKPPVGAWVEARDPVEEQSGSGEEDFEVAFAQPAVRRLLAGHRFFVDGAIAWQRCNGSALGSIVSLRIWPPVDFRGEIPILGETKENEDVSYRAGRAYVEAERVTAVWIYVDHQQRRVVGVELDAFDEAQDVDELPLARITKRDILKEPVPAGGPDDSSQCPKDEPGE
jgi:hypothetical protein